MYNLTAKYTKEINSSYVKVGAIKLVANRLIDYKMRNFYTLSVRLYHI